MDNYFERARTSEDYKRQLNGTSLPATTPVDKERDFNLILSQFRQVMSSYQAANGNWWYGSILNMKQQLKMGDMQSVSAALDAKQVDAVMSCSDVSQEVTVTHGFRSTRYIPIPNAAFRVVKRRAINPSGYAAARYGGFTRNGNAQNDIPVGKEQRFDAQGKAVVKLPPCEPGYQYHMLVNSNITEQDRQALYADYQEVVDRYAAWLTDKWNTQQRAAWASFLEDGFSLSQTASAFLDGMVTQFKQLYQTVKQVWEWVSNADKYAAQLAEFIGNDGVAQLKALTNEGGRALDEALTLLSDEILIFILANALYSYFQLLTPQQIANFVAEAFGSLLVMIALYLALPAGIGQLVLKSIDNLSMFAPV